MDDLKGYVVSLYSGCKEPAKQVELICELTGRKMAEVLKILREAGRIPTDVTTKNYKKVLKRTERKISREAYEYIVGSLYDSRTVAKRVGLSVETVIRIREEAYKKAGGTYNNGRGTLEEFKTGCARYEKNAERDGKRIGKGNRRVRQKRAAGA